ncbi:hypothetical protein FACS189475_04050 [Betaproteobacteria bacterium]|nr:hypothetical protein FACS189475_04050 [Betaproteobacteria bacterium]
MMLDTIRQLFCRLVNLQQARALQLGDSARLSGQSKLAEQAMRTVSYSPLELFDNDELSH